jgi:ectoine hydroxylase-related dioxygenase (phytanoyl-CoA dioxygenase family)
MAPSAIQATEHVLPSVTKTLKLTEEPRVGTLSAQSATADDVVQALIRDGGVVVRNYVSSETLSKLKAELSPYLAHDEGYEGAFFPRQTRRVLGVAGKSPTYCEELIAHPLWKEVTEILLTTTSSNWNGDELFESVSKPQINATAPAAIGPGARAQPLHRDDMIHHPRLPEITAEQYEIGRDTGVGVFVAGVRTTKENGATRFQPGSHLQNTMRRPDEGAAVQVELEAGDAFIMLASCYHGGSANTTKDVDRWMYALFMTKGYLRQV